MDLVIPFTPTEEARLTDAARRAGVTVVELVKRRALGHLPPTPPDVEAEVLAKLRKWQEEDPTPLRPHIPVHELFAQWDEEDAQMTDEERAEEDRIWEGFEEAIERNRLEI